MNNLKVLRFFFIIYLLISIFNLPPVIGIVNKGLSVYINYIGFICLLITFSISNPVSSSGFSKFLFSRSLQLPLFVILFYTFGVFVAIFNNNYAPFTEALPSMIRCSLFVFIITWLFCYLFSKKQYTNYIKIFTFLLVASVSSILILHARGIELSYLIDNTLDSGDDIIGRSSGFFLNANVAAQYSIFAIIFLLYFFQEGKLKFHHKIILISLIFICVYALISTFSTTGLINILLIFVYFIFNRYKNKLKFLVHAVLILLLFQSAVLSMQIYIRGYYHTANVPQVQQEKIDNFLNLLSFNKTKKIDYSKRNDLIKKGIEKINERPFFGHGAGSFNSNILNGLGVHNTYLQIIGETGFFVFAIYLIVMIRILIRCVKIKDKSVNFLLSASFLTIIVYQLTTHGVLYSEPMLLIMILINCASIYVNYLEKRTNAAKKTKSLSPLTKAYA